MEPLNDDDDDDGFDASFLEVSLSEPTSAGSGLGKHINYKMTVRTTFEVYKAREFSVVRRYNDFARLHKALHTKYKGIAFPQLPVPKMNGRFGDKFVKERMSALEDCVNWVALHPILRNDTLVHNFLQLPQDVLQANFKALEQQSMSSPTITAGGSASSSPLLIPSTHTTTGIGGAGATSVPKPGAATTSRLSQSSSKKRDSSTNTAGGVV